MHEYNVDTLVVSEKYNYHYTCLYILQILYNITIVMVGCYHSANQISNYLQIASTIVQIFLRATYAKPM